MVEKPPLHIYDIYLEVEAHGGHGGIWRPFYLLYIPILYSYFSDLLLRVLRQVPRGVRTTSDDESAESGRSFSWVVDQFRDPFGGFHPYGWHHEQWNDFLLYYVIQQQDVVDMMKKKRRNKQTKINSDAIDNMILLLLLLYVLLSLQGGYKKYVLL